MAINLSLLKRSFSKAAHTYEQQAHMQNIMAQELCYYLKSALGSSYASTASYSPYNNRGSIASSLPSIVLDKGLGSCQELEPWAGASASASLCPSRSFSHSTNKEVVANSTASLDVNTCAKSNIVLKETNAGLANEAAGNDKNEAAVFNRVLEIGCGPGNFTKILLHNFKVKELCLNDLSSCMIEKNIASLNILRKQDPALDIAISAICGNALELNNKQELAQPFDILVSNATFQWFNDLESSLKHLASFVRNQDISLVNSKSRTRGGRLIAFSSFYEGNFAQIKKLTGMSLNYLTKEQVISALDKSTLDYQVYFSSHEQYFDSSLALFRHLKDTGVTALSNSPLSASAFKELLRSYQEHYSSDKGVCLTWCPYYVVALI